MKHFHGLKYFLLTIQAEPGQLTPPISNTNYQVLVYGSSGSGKSSFIVYYSNQTKANYLVFGRDTTEIHEQNFVPLLQLAKIETESLENKTTKMDDAAAYQELTSRHHNIQFIYIFAHYAKDLSGFVCQ